MILPAVTGGERDGSDRRLKRMIEKLLSTVVNRNATDLHICPGQPPVVRVDGHLLRARRKPLDADDCLVLMKEITPERNQRELQEQLGTNFDFTFDDHARFRVAVFRQRKQIGMVLRRVSDAGGPTGT